jgi:Uma2 family endonuclease
VSVETRLLTVEEFWRLYADKPYELVRGEVVEIMPGVYSHGSVSSRAASKLGDFVDEHKLGDVVGAETGFRLSATTLHAPDAAFISSAKLAQITEPDKFLPFPPDLAVEVVSPGDTATEIQDKVNLYLDAGTLIVWVMYPDLQQVLVHRSDRTAKTISHDGFLDGEDVLPGLKIALSDLFPPQPDSKNQE